MKAIIGAALVAASLLLSACGGGGGDGSAATSAATPQPQAAGATSALTGIASDVADTTATVGGSFTNAKGYTSAAWFEWGSSTAYGTSTLQTFYASQGSVNVSATLPALTTGATYHYRLCTSNTDGTWCGTDKTLTTVAMAPKTQVATGLVNPVQFTINAGALYWTEGGQAPTRGTGEVKQLLLNTGNVTSLAQGLTDPSGVAADATNVYWTEQSAGNVKAAPVVGGAPPVLLASGLNNPHFVAVNATHVYFTEYGTWNADAGRRNADGTVKRVPIGGGPVETIASGLNGPASLALTSTRVYWTEVANFVGAAGAIKSTPLAGGAVTTLASGLSNSQFITVDATDLYYWSSYGTASRVPLGGTTPASPVVELLSGAYGSPALTNDASAVYWVENSGSGFVKKLIKATADVSIVSSGAANALGVAQDATSVYWLEGDAFNGTTWNGQGAIRKIAK